MSDNSKFDACVDWFYANRDSLLPQYHGMFAAQHCVTEEEESRVRVYTPWVDFSKTGVKDRARFAFRVPSEGASPI